MSFAKLLIVEDENALGLELRERLSALGYQVVGISSSGEEAVEQAGTLHPELVLINSRIRGSMDGLAAGNLIHTRFGIPVIYTTAYSGQETIRRSKMTGPFGYIFKPFDEKQVFATIEVALLRNQMEKQLHESREWLNAILTNIGDGVIAIDKQGSIRFMNPIAEDLTGWGQDSAAGKSLAQVFPIIDIASQESIGLPEFREISGATNSQKGFQAHLVIADGRQIPIEINIARIGKGEHDPEGMVFAFRDISDRLLAIQEIQHQANRAEALLDEAARLNSQLDLQSVLSTLCSVATQALKVSFSAVFLYDFKQDVYRSEALFRDEEKIPDYEETLVDIPSKDLYKLLSDASSFRVISDIKSYQEIPFINVLSKQDIRDLVIVALSHDNIIIGVLFVASIGKPRKFTQDELELLRGLSDQAANAIVNARLFEEVNSGRSRLQTLSRRLVEVQEAERRHLARDLHDQIGQVLTGLQFKLESAKLKADEQQKRILEEAGEMTSTLISLIRKISQGLWPSMLDDLGLLPTLLWHFDHYTDQTGIEVNFQSVGIDQRFPPEIETGVYRIVQEALTNVARSTKVTEVDVRIGNKDQLINVEVNDAGQGFDPLVVSNKPTSGLSGMRERANLLGGYVEINSSPGKGTRVVAVLPLNKKVERRSYDRNRSPG
jgi:PAS domain S-box-containing protein